MTQEEFKTYLKDKVFLIGITFQDENQKILDLFQTSGKVLEITENDMIKLALDNDNIFTIPYDLKSIIQAEKGEYREKTSGKIITNPDYIAQWSVTIQDIEDIKIIKEIGFVLP